MYFFWYFSSHLCWSPRYLCLNRSCLSYLLPPLPLSFWDATRQSGRECQRPSPGTSWTGEHLQDRGGSGSLLVSTKLGLRGSPWELGISLLLLSAHSLSSMVNLNFSELPCHFPPIRPLLPLRIFLSVLNMFIYLRRSALCHLLLEGFLDSSAKCSFVFPW